MSGRCGRGGYGPGVDTDVPSRPRSTLRIVPAAVAVVPLVAVAVLLAGCGGGTDGSAAPDGSAGTSGTPRSSAGGPEATATVERVVDGDTLEVSSGDRVRLIGIDTPEVGECGDDEAAAVLRRLVDGRRVSLVAGASQDRDRYGRLLRYVEVDGVDANLVLLQRGRAIARYDSRDGYGPHAREGAYIAADRASPTANVCAAPAAPSTILAPGAPDGSDPRFGACHDAVANGYGPYVAGRDPEYDWYGDADGDGVNCE